MKPKSKKKLVIHKTALEHIKESLNTVLNTFDTATARVFNIVMIVLIIISTGIFVLDTLAYFDPWQKLFDQLEAIVAILFTAEYVLRVWVAPKPKWKFVGSVYGIFDLLAIAPFYLGFAPIGFLRSFRMIRMLRVLRVLRLLKLSRQAGQMLTEKERHARAFQIEMQIFAIAVITVVLIFAGIMYAIENPNNSPGFQNIPSAMWYVIVTITTVGYGDIVPSTVMGKIVAAFIMLSGTGFLGILTGIIGKAMLTQFAIDEKNLNEEE